MKEVESIITYKIVYDCGNVYKSYKKDNYYELNNIYKVDTLKEPDRSKWFFNDILKLMSFTSFTNLNTKSFSNEFLNKDGNFMEYYKSKSLVLLKCIVPEENIVFKGRRFGCIQSNVIIPIKLIGSFENYLKYRDM